ncbi:MAG: FAD-dependent oxidoreductase [Rhodospirillales bacterium]|nr:FAD-dependent oxidoreductase [Rhodospirillales bacterium]
MKTEAQVVIVGGGIMGASLLYHLAKEGWSDCVLVEKAELTSGSTWHAAGQTTHSISHLGLAKMNGYGIELYQRLEAETGQSVTWHGCGSLRLAYTPDEVDWLKYTLSIGRGLGHAMEIVGPDEVRRLHPFYNTEGVLAALHTPNDGHLDPAGGCFALAKGARQMGATVIRGNLVTNIERAPDGAWRVTTEQGDIRCRHVVNAGGCYARQIGQWVGLDLPIVNVLHHYLVTDTVPEFLELERELPVVRDDHVVSGYIRQEQKSALIGIYEKADPGVVWLEGAPWEAEHELFEPDYDRIGPWLEAAMGRLPVVSELGIKRVVHGAIPDTPDGAPLLGPAPGLENFWCACGAQVGIAWGPGAGRYLAQWMVRGTAEINMRSFDPRRFGPYAGPDYALAKAKEDYRLRHEIPFPGRDRPAGRPVKTTALYERLKARGAVFEEVFGWERPAWFAPEDMAREHIHGFRRPGWFEVAAEECRAVRERVGLGDFSAFAKLEVTGPDAEGFLNRLSANRMPSRDGGIVLAHMLNELGTIEGEFTVLRLAGDRFYLVCAAVAELKMRDWLMQHRRDGEQVGVENVSQDYGVIVLAGPKARSVLARVSDARLDNGAFRWLSGREIEVCGVPCRALRVSFTGELAWELHVPMAGMLQVHDGLWDAGRGHGIAHFGSYALNSLRMEKAYKTGLELTNEVTLVEADLMRFCKLDKDDFIGRAATLKSQQQGARFRAVCLSLEAAGADCLGAETVFANGRAVGAVSSGAHGHHTGHSLAFAYVDPACAGPGTALDVMVLGERRPAKVLAQPVFDPDNERPRD